MSKMLHTKEHLALVEHLKKARRESNLTQTEVAEKLGYKQPYISKIESGEIRIDAVELQRFARLYGKNMTYFLK